VLGLTILSSVTTATEFLESIGLSGADAHALPESAKRFPDGAQVRIEIPSTEGPACLDAVLEEAQRLDVPIHRVSQGSGVLMLTDAELDSMARIAADAVCEVSLFARPNAGWDNSVMARGGGGAVAAAAARGTEQLVAVLDDVTRAAAAGIRSVLLADLGALSVFGQMRAAGAIPRDMQAKISVMLPAANPASARVLVQLGADTLNLPTDLTLAQIAAMRAAVDIPFDIYVESPDSIGGLVRLTEVAALVRVAAPVYIKFGLRNAPDLYPSGRHLEAMAILQSRERVHRARLGLEILARSGAEFAMSKLGAEGIALPQLPARAEGVA
jgi:hypothetical protein